MRSSAARSPSPLPLTPLPVVRTMRTGADKKSIEGYSEMYVCPKAFSGEYRLLVRRVHADLLANIRADIERHDGEALSAELREEVGRGPPVVAVTHAPPTELRVDGLGPGPRGRCVGHQPVESVQRPAIESEIS